MMMMMIVIIIKHFDVLVLQRTTFLTVLITCPLEKRCLDLSALWTAQRRSLLIVRHFSFYSFSLM